MGNTINTGEPNEESANNVKLDIDLKKEVEPNLKQMLNWSLGEIREIYTNFKRRRNSPLLNRTEFARLIGLSRTTSFYIYPFLSKKQPISVFDIMCILVLTSYSKTGNKIHLLFLIFDLTARNNLILSQMILMYKSLVRGFCRLTGQQCPDQYLLDKYSKLIFTKSDLNEDQGIQIEEVVDLFENNVFATQLFARFESKHKIKEDYGLFNKFTAYSNEEAQLVKSTVLRGLPFNLTIPPIRPLTDSQNTPARYMRRSLPMKMQQLRLRDLNAAGVSMAKSKSGHRPLKVMIIKGVSVTKKEIFKLKEYFESLSSGHSSITMAEFLEAFSSDKYDHMRSITASLFNFLDHRQRGCVTFKDLVRKVYPGLEEYKYTIIEGWVRQYEKLYNSDKKRNTEKKQQAKKRTLPKSCLIRLKEIFDLFDKQKKGWVSFDNLKKAFGQVYTEKELFEMFEARDADKDGKLNLEQFIKILLPSDIQIEGMKSN